jgi:cysteine desulfurase
MIRLDLAGFAVSTGSACSSGAIHVSRTMAAMGVAPDEAVGSLRVSFGKGNTEAEVDGFLAALEREVTVLRAGRAAMA